MNATTTHDIPRIYFSAACSRDARTQQLDSVWYSSCSLSASEVSVAAVQGMRIGEIRANNVASSVSSFLGLVGTFPHAPGQMSAHRAQRLAQPLLDEMAPVPGTLKVGVHIRIGDSGLSNALKKQDERYPLGCVADIIMHIS